MKNIFASILLCLLTTGHLYSQSGCCPYIGSITIIPASPTTNDIIKIVTSTTTPNEGSEISYNFTQQADTFNLIGCFWEGFLTHPLTFLDTTTIGMLPAGTYFVNYVAYSSMWSTSCSVIDTSSMTASFQVTVASGLENINSDDNYFSIYPNPANSELNIQNNSSYSIQFTLYNSLGEKIIDEKLTGKINTINLSGYSNDIYFYRLRNDKQEIKNGKIIKQ